MPRMPGASANWTDGEGPLPLVERAGFGAASLPREALTVNVDLVGAT